MKVELAPGIPQKTILNSWYSQHYKFKALAELAWERANNRNDTILFINGPRGTGKSMAGVAQIRYYLENFLHTNFNKQSLRDHTVYEHELLFERAKYLPDKHPILVDEGVRVAYTGDFGTKEVKDLIKFFAQCRTKNRFVIFVAPDFFDVAKRLRQYAHYRLRMVERGLGVLFARDNSEGVDPFHLDTLKEFEKYHDETTATEDVINRIKKHPCYKDTITIPEVPKVIQDWYDEYRDANVYGDAGSPVGGWGLNEKPMMLIHNLLEKWENLKLLTQHTPKQRLTKKLVYEQLCMNPVTQEMFWADAAPLTTQLAKLNAQIEKQKQKQELVKDSLLQQIPRIKNDVKPE